MSLGLKGLISEVISVVIPDSNDCSVEKYDKLEIFNHELLKILVFVLSMSNHHF